MSGSDPEGGQAKQRTQGSKYLPALTGLRAVAAAMVFMHHYYGQLYWWHKESIPLSEGYLGVTVFFTLSGYLITRTYLERFVSKQISFGNYWFRRFARVYPPYLLLLAIVLIFAKPPSGLGQVLANVTLMQGFFLSHLWSGISPAWSLTSEECFYLLAPLIFSLFAILRPTRQRLWVLAAISIALWFGGQAIVAIKPPGDFLASDFYMRIYTIFGRFTEFGIGIAVALLVMRSGDGLTRKRSRIVIESGLPIFAIAIVASVLLMLHFRELHHENYGINTIEGFGAIWLLALATGALIWCTTQGSRISSLILGNRPMEYLGRISYIFYLLQESTFSHLILNSTGDNPWLAYFSLNGAAALIYTLVEKPVHSRLIAWLDRRTPITKRVRRTVPA